MNPDATVFAFCAFKSAMFSFLCKSADPESIRQQQSYGYHLYGEKRKRERLKRQLPQSPMMKCFMAFWTETSLKQQKNKTKDLHRPRSMAGCSVTLRPLTVLQSQWSGEITRVEKELRNHLIILQTKKLTVRKETWLTHEDVTYNVGGSSGATSKVVWLLQLSDLFSPSLPRSLADTQELPGDPFLLAKINYFCSLHLGPTHPSPTTVLQTSILFLGDSQILQDAWLDFCGCQWR